MILKITRIFRRIKKYRTVFINQSNPTGSQLSYAFCQIVLGSIFQRNPDILGFVSHSLHHISVEPVIHHQTDCQKSNENRAGKQYPHLIQDFLFHSSSPIR